MAEMTHEARDRLEGYLREVTRLAQSQGDDAIDIVEGLREHISGELGELSAEIATLDDLRAILDRIGTPAEIMELDAPLSGLGERTTHVAAELASEVRADRTSRQRIVRGCLFAAAVGATCVFLSTAVLFFLLAAPTP